MKLLGSVFECIHVLQISEYDGSTLSTIYMGARSIINLEQVWMSNSIQIFIVRVLTQQL
jgi:hypothetical protein